MALAVALRRVLPALDEDTIAAILVSSDGVLTRDALASLLAMHADAGAQANALFVDEAAECTDIARISANIAPRFVIVDAAEPPSAAHIELQQGQVLCFLPCTDDVVLHVAASSSQFATWPGAALGVLPASVAHDATSSVTTFDCATGGVLMVSDFGAFSVGIASECGGGSGAVHSFQCVTPSYRAARALDQLFDCFFWGWTCSVASASAADELRTGFTSRLEFALVQLLVSVEEEFLPAFESMSRMMPAEASEMNELGVHLRKSLKEALDERDAHAIGTIHQTLHQILEMDPGSGDGGFALPIRLVPPSFTTVVREFECAKSASLSASAFATLRAAVDETRAALARYRHSLIALEATRLEAHQSALAQFQAQRQQAQMIAALSYQAMPLMQAPAAPPSLRADVTSLDTSCANLARVCEQMDAAASGGSGDVEWHLLTRLKAKKLTDMFAMIMGADAGAALDTRVLAPMPSIPMVHIGEPDARVLDRFVDCFLQNCVGGSAMLGSLLGFKLDAQTPVEHGVLIIRNLLRAGFGFVGSGGRVIALINMRRAMLPLNRLPALDARRFAARCKDVARILRTKLKAPAASCDPNSSPPSSSSSSSSSSTLAAPAPTLLPPSALSLRCSTDFAAVMRGVHAHHAPSWVSPALERVWRHMVESGEALTFELWLRTPRFEAVEVTAVASNAALGASGSADVSSSATATATVTATTAATTATATVAANAIATATAAATAASISSSPALDAPAPAAPRLVYDEQLIAADVCFPVGRSCYVATRFASRAHKTLAPGFVLAFASARVLQAAGYELWDLGGTDSSPMMSYKREIAIESFRPDAMQHFRRVRGMPGAPAALPLRAEVVAALAGEHLFDAEAASLAAPARAASAAVGAKSGKGGRGGKVGKTK